MRFKTSVFILFIFLACGPKPEVKVQIELAPAQVWDGYFVKYQDISSIALSGTLSIFSAKAYDCKLQLIYIYPDSFAFLAEGSFGVDIVRGTLVADSGFFEIPREKYHQKLSAGDNILLNDDIEIDINSLLQAVFFFRAGCDFKYIDRSGSRYIYLCDIEENKKLIEINVDSFTPIRQIFYNLSDTLTVGYYEWKVLSDNVILPGRIKIISNVSDLDIDYRIKKVKVNPDVKMTFFRPGLQ